MEPMVKYPRTRHVTGSKIQSGDEDLETVPASALYGKHLVIEEKMDGANTGISFSSDGELLLQSRGHYLRGGPREKQFTLFKQWASSHENRLFDLLEDRYILYGEWLYAKHTIFYDALSHYFMEFDIYDKVTGKFFSTARRREMLKNFPFIVSVRVIDEFQPDFVWNEETLWARLEHNTSAFRVNPYAVLWRLATSQGFDPDKVLKESDVSENMEGLYIKVEEGDVVTGRLKYVWPWFVQKILDSESHWHDRPIIPNQLRPGVDMFAE